MANILNAPILFKRTLCPGTDETDCHAELPNESSAVFKMAKIDPVLRFFLTL